MMDHGLNGFILSTYYVDGSTSLPSRLEEAVIEKSLNNITESIVRKSEERKKKERVCTFVNDNNNVRINKCRLIPG